MKMKTLIWLASYPKSGNTWVRMFLANYLFNQETPVPINQAARITVSDSSTKSYSKVAGRPISTVDHTDALQIRPRFLQAIARGGADINFIKTHDVNATVFGVELIPDTLTKGAVYILRNPLDVVLSYARHFGVDHARAVAHLNDPNNSTTAGARNVKQFLSSWSDHVASWVDADLPFPVLVLRYEDMLATPHDVFARLVRHLGLPYDDARLEKAVRFSVLDELQRQEAVTGFVEQSRNSERFFHTGQAGQWQSALAPDLAAELRSAHGKMMDRFGYL